MNWNPKWLLEHGLKPLTPAILTGAVILGCAHAPNLQQLPALLSLDAESSVAEEVAAFIALFTDRVAGCFRRNASAARLSISRKAAK